MEGQIGQKVLDNHRMYDEAIKNLNTIEERCNNMKDAPGFGVHGKITKYR